MFIDFLIFFLHTTMVIVQIFDFGILAGILRPLSSKKCIYKLDSLTLCNQKENRKRFKFDNYFRCLK